MTKARGATRDIDFSTSEGTWMSADLSPDGSWIVFDLLAQVYRVPAEGGEAQCLTQSSGVALNFHPRISPDGTTIAFVSDRQGQNNLWLMNADGSEPRAVFVDKDVRASEPAWSPDGRYIYVHHQDMRRGGGAGIWITRATAAKASRSPGATSAARIGRVLLPTAGFCISIATASQGTWSGRADVMQGAKQVRRMELRTGRITEMTSGESVQQSQGSSGGAIAPELSPDGRWMSFARRIPDGTIAYKNQTFGPRMALWLRDLHSGAERVAMDPIELDMSEGMKVGRDLPGYSWSRDSRIVIAQGGKSCAGSTSRADE